MKPKSVDVVLLNCATVNLTYNNGLEIRIDDSFSPIVPQITIVDVHNQDIEKLRDALDKLLPKKQRLTKG